MGIGDWGLVQGNMIDSIASNVKSANNNLVNINTELIGDCCPP